MRYEWDRHKAVSNQHKHGISFADAVRIFEDEYALWREDDNEYDEDRFIIVGKDFLGRILTVVFSYRDDNIRLISARKATKGERKYYEQRI